MDARHDRRLAWIAFAAVAAVVVAWLLWTSTRDEPRDPTRPADAATRAESESKPRAEHRRDAAPADPQPESEPQVAAPAPPAEKTPAFTFTVTVLRSDGTPASGASVVLLDMEEEDGIAKGSATADEQGVATMRVGTGIVRVAAWLGADAVVTEELFAVESRHAATVRLGPAFVVRGRVVRGASAPEAGTEVELECHPWFGRDPGLELHAATDADGRFEFAALPRDGIDPLNPPYASVLTKDSAHGLAEVDLDRADAELVVRLVEPFTVRGRFVDAQGRPLAASLTAAGWRTREGKAGDDGRIAMRIPQGRFKLIARRETGHDVIQDFDVEVVQSPGMVVPDPIFSRWNAAKSLGVHADGAGDVDLGDVVLAAGKPLRGVVVDALGTPVPRARLSLSLDDVHVGTVVANADGRFEFPEVGDEPHAVHVSDPRTEGNAGTADVANVRGGDPELRVVLQTKGLFVRLKFFSEGDRKPVKASDVAVKAFRHGEKVECAGHHIYSDAECLESDRVDVPEPGSYDLEVVVGGYEPVRLESVEILANRPTSLDLLLRRKRE
jgi:hypothetical protein